MGPRTKGESSKDEAQVDEKQFLKPVPLREKQIETTVNLLYLRMSRTQTKGTNNRKIIQGQQVLAWVWERGALVTDKEEV